MKSTIKDKNPGKPSIYISWKNDTWVAIFNNEIIFSDKDQDLVIEKALDEFRGERIWLKIENKSGALRQATPISPN